MTITFYLRIGLGGVVLGLVIGELIPLYRYTSALLHILVVKTGMSTLFLLKNKIKWTVWCFYA